MEINNSSRIARIISTIFVPPSFTLIIFTFLAFHFENDLSKRMILILVSFFFGFLFHILLFIYFKRKGKLIDLDASIKEERTLPFIFSAIIYLIGIFILILNNINLISIAFWFCYISNTLIVVLINKNWKISVHAMGSSGPLAVLMFLLGPIGSFFIVIPFVVGWSRIKLKCHTFSQVLVGTLVGFISTYIQILLIVKWFSNDKIF